MLALVAVDLFRFLTIMSKETRETIFKWSIMNFLCFGVVVN